MDVYIVISHLETEYECSAMFYHHQLSPLPVSVLKIAGSGALLLVSGLDIE